MTFFWVKGAMIWFKILFQSINHDCKRCLLFGENKISSNNPRLRWFNILSPSLNQDRKRCLLFRKKKISTCNIILPGIMVTPRLREPLNFGSGWGYLGQTDYSHQQQISLCSISFTEMRDVTQNNELLIQITWSYKYCYIKNWRQKGKKERILKGIRLWNWINIRQAVQLFNFTRRIKPVEEVSWANLLLQENWAIQKSKDTSFLHLLLTKRLLKNSQDYNNESRPYPLLPLG